MFLNSSGVAFITGAGGSLGRAVVLQFARDGVRKIAGVDIAKTALEETGVLLKNTFPEARFLPLVADLTDEAQVQTAFDRLLATWGRVDYAVNNAGVAHPMSKTADAEASNLDKVFGVNLKGVWFCERLKLAQMAKQEPRPVHDAIEGRSPARGAIVNVSSVLGLRAMPNLAFYSMSKHGILGLTKTDALDYAKLGVRVNAVCPGFIDTPLLNDETRKGLAPCIANTAMGRLAHPQEVADAITFLCSDRASYITGISLTVDGGYCVQ